MLIIVIAIQTKPKKVKLFNIVTLKKTIAVDSNHMTSSGSAKTHSAAATPSRHQPPSPSDECADLVRPGLCARVRADLPEIRCRLRERHPVPSFRELRRARMPLYESLHSELIEDDYPETAAFLQQLIEQERKLHASATEGKKLTFLHRIGERLEQLLNAVRLTEKPSDLGRGLAKHVDTLMWIGVEFANGRTDYQWVAEGSLLRALREARKVRTDGVETIARVLYFLGKFYFRSEWSIRL